MNEQRSVITSKSYYSPAYGILDEVGLIVDVQFIHQAGLVPFHSLGADNQHVGYFAGSMSLSDELEYFPFSICQLLVRVFPPFGTDFRLVFFNEGGSC